MNKKRLPTYKSIYFFINRSAEAKKSPDWWLNGWAQSDPLQVLGTDLQSQGKAFREAVRRNSPASLSPGPTKQNRGRRYQRLPLVF
jgi:hypothetical protein